jgi:general secretion pathway protein A
LYTDFYDLIEKPFELGPDLRYLYLSAHHQEALAHLTYGVQERKSFVQLTGEVGMGKTTMLDALVDGLDVTTKVARLSYTTIGEEDLLRELARELGVEPLTGPKIELRRRIEDHLDEWTGAGRNAVFIVDESQNLSLEVLEEVRLLSNLRSVGLASLQIVLAGQPELREKLALKELRQLRQRIGIRYHLVPLSRAEAAEYIAHRLAVAGASDTGIFDSGAIDEIYSHSEGVPRVINIACDRALLAGYAEGRRRIGRKLMRETIVSMEGVPPGEDEREPEEQPAEPTGRRWGRRARAKAGANPGPTARNPGPEPGDAEHEAPEPAHEAPEANAEREVPESTYDDPSPEPEAVIPTPAASKPGREPVDAQSANVEPAGAEPASEEEPEEEAPDGDDEPADAEEEERSEGAVLSWARPRARSRVPAAVSTVVIIAAAAVVFTLLVRYPGPWKWPDWARKTTVVNGGNESETHPASGESSMFAAIREPGVAASEIDAPPETDAPAAEETNGPASPDDGGPNGSDTTAESPGAPSDELGAGGGPVAGTGGPFEVVVTSVTTEDGAWGEAVELLEAGYSVGVERADLGEKGVWYRVIVEGGFPTLDEARKVVSMLTGSGFDGAWVSRSGTDG